MIFPSSTNASLSAEAFLKLAATFSLKIVQRLEHLSFVIRSRVTSILCNWNYLSLKNYDVNTFLIYDQMVTLDGYQKKICTFR